MLPYYFGLAKLIPGVLFEGLLLGAAAVYFYNAYLDAADQERLTLRSALKSWPHLLLAWCLLNGLTMFISLFAPDWLRFFHDDSPRRLLLVQWVIMPAVFTFVLSLLYFAVPAVAIYRVNVFRALGRSLRVFLRRPFTCFFLSAAVLAGPYILSQIAGYSGDIIAKFHPELVYWVLLAGLAVELVANFFWMGTAVRFLLIRDEHL